MSFVHSTIVGHFDPATLRPFNVVPFRKLDAEAFKRLLSQFPEAVAEHVQLREGYAECWWADGASIGMAIGKAVHEFAYRLAEQEGCIAAETPLCVILYPESAKKAQQEAFHKWRVSHEGDRSEHPT